MWRNLSNGDLYRRQARPAISEYGLRQVREFRQRKDGSRNTGHIDTGPTLIPMKVFESRRSIYLPIELRVEPMHPLSIGICMNIDLNTMLDLSIQGIDKSNIAFNQSFVDIYHGSDLFPNSPFISSRRSSKR